MCWFLSTKCFGNNRGISSVCLLSKSFQCHSLQLNGKALVIYRRALHAGAVRPLCFARTLLRHLHVFVKIRTIHENRCLWSVLKFFWFEDFNLPDASRQFTLKLALLNETSMCWNVDISRNGYNLGMNFIPSFFYPKRKPRISFSCIPDRNFREPDRG